MATEYFKEDIYMKNIKKIICLFIAAVMVLSVLPFSAFAGNDKLCFHEDGTFKVLMINDTQDNEKLNSNTVEFLTKACQREKPDLVCIAGDILSDIWPFASEEKLEKNFNEMCSLLESLGVHFAITMGNHDHDRCDECSSVAHMMAVATKYKNHVDTSDCCDPATYSIPIYSHDASTVKYVIYMMDSNNKGEALSMSGYTGLYPEQIEWYKATAEKYKEANGGVYVPSTVIQHVPVAEIYDFLKEIPMANYIDTDSVFSSNDYKWYKLNNEDYPDMTGSLGEAPCSELVSTGEYTAWTQTGVVSAFFAHDHVNSFAATTKDGIYMGYNGGTGFNSYGFGDKRSCRVIRLDENNLKKIDTNLIYFKDVVGKNMAFYPTDILSPVIITKLMQTLCLIPSLFCKLFGI